MILMMSQSATHGNGEHLPVWVSIAHINLYQRLSPYIHINRRGPATITKSRSSGEIAKVATTFRVCPEDQHQANAAAGAARVHAGNPDPADTRTRAAWQPRAHRGD